MNKIKLEKPAAQDAIEQIKQYYWRERGEEISNFQAESYLEFILSELGPYIYNQAISDAYKVMSQKIEDLYELEKHPR